MVETHSLLFREHCPICENKLLDLKSYSFVEKVWGCKNKCYVVTMPYFQMNDYTIKIFNHTIWVRNDRHMDYYKAREIEDLIEYWRKDQMYLTKIMGVE